MEAISVHVVKYRDRDNLMMRYACPLTGKQIARSTGTARRKEAEKIAAKWESELQEGRYQRDSRMGWEEFRILWEESRLSTIKPSTGVNYCASMNAFEKHCRPRCVADLTTPRVTTFAIELRKRKLSEASVGRHLRCLKSIARWANRQGLLPDVPAFDMPKSAAAAKMKGRPITGEEFDRMIMATDAIVGEKAGESWRLLLRGLWCSGLRLGEALALRWDQQPGGITVMMNGRKSVLAFDAGSQKSGKVQLVPLAPEAVQLLEPIKQSSGYVFSPCRKDGSKLARTTLAIGKRICKIGKKAGVVVSPEIGKTASAHDLRRAFGYRWSRLVMPVDLKALMRHSSIDTTMTYYVGQNATHSAEALWKALGNNQGNNGKKEEDGKKEKRKKTLAGQ